MSITVTITDPHTIPRQEMIAITDYLLLVAQPRVESKPYCRAEPLLAIAEPEVPQCKTEPAPVDNEEPAALFAPEQATPVVIEEPTAVAPAFIPALPELDVRGLPWDSRIHSSSKNRNADGSWRKLRGVHDGFVADVERELRGTMEAPTAPAVPVVPTPTAGAPEVPEVPAVPVESFNDFMQYLTPKLAAGEINPAQVAGVIASVELPHIGALFNRPDLIPAVKQKIEALLCQQ